MFLKKQVFNVHFNSNVYNIACLWKDFSKYAILEGLWRQRYPHKILSGIDGVFVSPLWSLLGRYAKLSLFISQYGKYTGQSIRFSFNWQKTLSPLESKKIH